jgi:mycoredoxin
VEDRKFICPCYRHERDIAEMGHCLCHLFVDDTYEPVVVEESPVRAEDSPWPLIVIYGASWCRDTRRTRRFLNEHGIGYEYVDVTTDTQAAQRVMDWNGGNLSTPTLEIEGHLMTEPSDEELARFLGLTEWDSGRDDSR